MMRGDLRQIGLDLRQEFCRAEKDAGTAMEQLETSGLISQYEQVWQLQLTEMLREQRPSVREQWERNSKLFLVGCNFQRGVPNAQTDKLDTVPKSSPLREFIEFIDVLCPGLTDVAVHVEAINDQDLAVDVFRPKVRGRCGQPEISPFGLGLRNGQTIVSLRASCRLRCGAAA